MKEEEEGGRAVMLINTLLSLFSGKSVKSSQTCCPRTARRWETHGRSLFLNRESRAA